MAKQQARRVSAKRFEKDGDPFARKWNPRTPEVKAAFKYVEKKGAITAGQLVEWDNRNGRKLFEWDDGDAAREFRLGQARVFLNRFRLRLNGFRVRAFVHIPGKAIPGVKADDGGAYYPAKTIQETPSMRRWVIEDLAKRAASLGAELRLWKASLEEFDRVVGEMRRAWGMAEAA